MQRASVLPDARYLHLSRRRRGNQDETDHAQPNWEDIPHLYSLVHMT
jgi:hypothetical protein